MKKLALLFLLLVACDTPEESAMKLEYGKDPRTGLCFAMYNMGLQSGTMANVPCTPEVEKQIELHTRPKR